MADIYQKFIINAPAQEVFDGFCLPKQLDNWWTKQCTGKPSINEVYNFHFSDEYNWFAKVVHVIPGKELTWQMTGAMEDWMGTQVGFRLAPEKTGTSVLFFHKHWQEPNDHFAITTFCWGQLLNGLKNYLEKGEIVPFEKRN
jgi:uncharacterized protein YndB with AHSA1/START domain